MDVFSVSKPVLSHFRIHRWSIFLIENASQWEFQDPKMEVLYHRRPYFAWTFPYIGLTWALYMYGRYLQFRFLKWPVNMETHHSIPPAEAMPCWAPWRRPTSGSPLSAYWRHSSQMSWVLARWWAPAKRWADGKEPSRSWGSWSSRRPKWNGICWFFAPWGLIINTQPNRWNFMSKNRFRNLIGEIWGFMRQELEGARWD